MNKPLSYVHKVLDRPISLRLELCCGTYAKCFMNYRESAAKTPHFSLLTHRDCFPLLKCFAWSQT